MMMRTWLTVMFNMCGVVVRANVVHVVGCTLFTVTFAGCGRIRRACFISVMRLTVYSAISTLGGRIELLGALHAVEGKLPTVFLT